MTGTHRHGAVRSFQEETESSHLNIEQSSIERLLWELHKASRGWSTPQCSVGSLSYNKAEKGRGLDPICKYLGTPMGDIHSLVPPLLVPPET